LFFQLGEAQANLDMRRGRQRSPQASLITGRVFGAMQRAAGCENPSSLVFPVMSDSTFSRAADAIAASPVPSPCISVCRMDPRTGLCEGCCRTLDEIAAWAAMSDSEKRVVWGQLERRRSR